MMGRTAPITRSWPGRALARVRAAVAQIAASPEAQLDLQIYLRAIHGEPSGDIADSLNLRGIPTRCGGQWNASLVRQRLKFVRDDVRALLGQPRRSRLESGGLSDKRLETSELDAMVLEALR